MMSKGNGETILLAEDDRHTAELLRQMLEALNYRILQTANGRDALTQYQRHGAAIDLVLTDMIMPTMNGVELIRAIRAIDASVRIIVLSGTPRQAFPRDVKQAVSCWLRKPTDPTRLAFEIQRALK